MSPARKLLTLMVTLIALVTLASAIGCRTETVMLPGKTDTLIVQLPGHRDTIIVTKLDTVVNEHYDTTVVTRPETLIVIKRDTVIQHDTVWRVDTLKLDHTPAYVCIYLTMGDTLAAFNWRDTPYCNAAHLATSVQGTWNTLLDVDSLVMQLPSVQSALTRVANRPPSPLILPGYWMKHR